MLALDLQPVRNRLAWALLHASRLKEQTDTWAVEALVVDKTGRVANHGFRPVEAGRPGGPNLGARPNPGTRVRVGQRFTRTSSLWAGLVAAA
jgi:hypothetical protein